MNHIIKYNNFIFEKMGIINELEPISDDIISKIVRDEAIESSSGDSWAVITIFFERSMIFQKSRAKFGEISLYSTAGILTLKNPLCSGFLDYGRT